VLFQEGQLRFGFHAFGNDMQAEVLRHVDDCLDHHRVTGVSRHVSQKTLVDLQLIEPFNRAGPMLPAIATVGPFPR
jgi:hypothetical protein